MVAVDNPSGSLQFMDAFYDIRHPFNNPNDSFPSAASAARIR